MAASGSDNGVLERVKILEVAGVFRRRDLLDATADALLLSGFDQADIDMVAARDARERFGVHVPVEELPDVPGAPRRPLIVREDLIEVLALVLGILIFFGAAAAAAVVISSGGSPLWTGAAAVVGAGAAGGVGVLIARALGRMHADSYTHDFATPRDRLVSSLRAATEIATRHGLVLSSVAHLVDGNLHPRLH